MYKHVFSDEFMLMPMTGMVHGLFNVLIDWHLCFSVNSVLTKSTFFYISLLYSCNCCHIYCMYFPDITISVYYNSIASSDFPFRKNVPVERQRNAKKLIGMYMMLLCILTGTHSVTCIYTHLIHTP